ncbi:MAG: hypothetical protein FD131_4234 [Rhodocyclaceae bacterium]|nr:MAG: hypothetical protein FD131_4234 [Rhodocyclaceae bacterium]
MKRQFLCSLVAIGYFATASANVTYDSIASAVETIEGNAHISLSKGVYESRVGSGKVIWTIPRDIVAKMDFQYAKGTLQYGVIDFGRIGTSVLIANDKGLCANFKIRKITIREGYVEPSPPETYIQTSSHKECLRQTISFQFSVGRLFSPQRSASLLLKGVPFNSDERICRQGTPNCYGTIKPDHTTNPVSYIEFNTIVPKKGKVKPALAVTLKADGSIEFPDGTGFVTVGPKSGLELQSAHYDVQSQSGSGVMRKIKLAVKSGQLLFGQTSLKLPEGGSLAFENLTIKKSDDQTIIRDGSFEGKLGDGSVVRLTSSAGKESFLNIKSASAKLLGLNMTFNREVASLSGAYGQLSIESSGSQLHLSDNLKVLLAPKSAGESIKIDLLLACSPGSPADCRPFNWAQEGRTVVKGTLSPIKARLEKGGLIKFSDQNKLAIESGAIETSLLTVDTDDKVSPISGKNIKIDLALSAQDWIIDEGTRVKAATFSLNSSNLEIAKKDPAPIGDIGFKATVSDLKASGIADVSFATAYADFAGKISRTAGSSTRLTDGELIANLSASSTAGESGAARIRIHDLELSSGSGTAKLDFAVSSLAGKQVISEFHQELKGVPGGRFKINVETVSVQYSLASPLKFDDAKIEFKDNKWSLPNVMNVPLNLNASLLPLDQGRIIARVQHEIGGGIVGKNYAQTSCKPEAKAIDKPYKVAGAFDILFEEKDGKPIRKLVPKGFSLDPPVEIAVDKSDCGNVAFLQCEVLGSLLTGGNPIAGVAAGLACNKGIDDQKKKLQEDAANKSAEYISGLNKELVFE